MNQHDAIYLNHAGTSWPKPESVLKAADSACRLEPADWPSLFEASQRTVAEFFHIERSRLLLTPSCTAALNIGLTDHSWSAGDRIVTSGYEHHALHRNVAKLSEHGVAVTTLPRGTRELIDLDALRRELSAGRVRLVALTAACNVTGQLLPIDGAIELAHEFGALILIDGAQIAGWWDLNVSETGVDLFTFAGHKGPHAPWGIGGLFVAPDVSMNSPAATCDHVESGTETFCAAMPGYCDVGSLNLAALAGLAAGCRWLSHAQQTDRLQNARDLARIFADSMRHLPGVVLHGDVPAERKVPTVAITVRNLSSVDMATRLKANGLITSGGFQCAPQVHQALGTDQSGVIRFSFGPKNNSTEVARAIEFVEKLSDG